MNTTEYLLCQLGEEAAEVTKEAAKSMRFGLDDVYEKTGPEPQVDRLVSEINDLIALVELCQTSNVLPLNLLSRDKIVAKKAKVFKYMQYAADKGTLQP